MWRPGQKNTASGRTLLVNFLSASQAVLYMYERSFGGFSDLIGWLRRLVEFLHYRILRWYGGATIQLVYTVEIYYERLLKLWSHHT